MLECEGDKFNAKIKTKTHYFTLNWNLQTLAKFLLYFLISKMFENIMPRKCTVSRFVDMKVEF